MATPVEFDGQNIVFGKDQPEYLPLPAKVLESAEGEVITCWKLTDEELDEINKTGVVWASQLTFYNQFQPQRIFGKLEVQE